MSLYRITNITHLTPEVSVVELCSYRLDTDLIWCEYLEDWADHEVVVFGEAQHLRVPSNVLDEHLLIDQDAYDALVAASEQLERDERVALIG